MACTSFKILQLPRLRGNMCGCSGWAANCNVRRCTNCAFLQNGESCRRTHFVESADGALQRQIADRRGEHSQRVSGSTCAAQKGTLGASYVFSLVARSRCLWAAVVVESRHPRSHRLVLFDMQSAAPCSAARIPHRRCAQNVIHPGSHTHLSETRGHINTAQSEQRRRRATRPRWSNQATMRAVYEDGTAT
jgi:hypothetical protein